MLFAMSRVYGENVLKIKRGVAKWHSALIRGRKKTLSGMGISWHDMLDGDLNRSLDTSRTLIVD
jgi:hypothetical protein